MTAIGPSIAEQKHLNRNFTTGVDKRTEHCYIIKTLKPRVGYYKGLSKHFLTKKKYARNQFLWPRFKGARPRCIFVYLHLDNEHAPTDLIVFDRKKMRWRALLNQRELTANNKTKGVRNIDFTERR